MAVRDSGMAGSKSRSGMSKRTTLLIVTLLFAVFALYAFINRWKLEEYWLYFTQERMPLAFEFDSLSEAWSEDSLHERFDGYPITCRTYMGGLPADRACGVDVKSLNGVPALYLSFFFAQDKLQFLSVNIPRWSLDDAKNYLRQRYGRPYARQLRKHHGVRLAGWKMPDESALLLNMQKPKDPFSWNSVLWVSASQCEAMGCYSSGGLKSLLSRMFGH